MAKFLNQILFFLFIFLTISRTFASAPFPTPPVTQLKSACFIDENDKDVYAISKTDDERYPIASVSKIFTAFMVASKYLVGGRAPFVTKVYVKEFQKGKFHVHIQGTGDPYFNRYKFHRIISMLNEIGVKTVELLTFDENVKFLKDTDSREEAQIGNFKFVPVEIKATVDFPSFEQVKMQFQKYWLLHNGYNLSFSAAKAAGIKMIPNARVVFKKVEYVYSGQAPFGHPKSTDKEPSVREFYVESQSLVTMLKMMNWNSNNFSANRFYVNTGGEDFFNSLFYNQLRLRESDLIFFNGSGQNHQLLTEGRIYNESRCSVVVRVLRALSRNLEKQGKKIFDVLPVMVKDEKSTVSSPVYKHELTDGTVAAKTGTIGTNVALAGVINTKRGNRYFMFNVELAQRGTSQGYRLAQQAQGRRIIREKLLDLIKQTPDVVAFDYKAIPGFMSQYGFEDYSEDAATDNTVQVTLGAPVLLNKKP